MQININGCDTVSELIHKTRHAELIMNRNPNTLILSTVLADRLCYELFGNELELEMPRWKKLIGSRYMDLSVKIATNKDVMYLEIFEIK